tara:strand:- start:102783 stop:103532 length:750 start_codon:yes stop_codon:yes gene_type:complete
MRAQDYTWVITRPHIDAGIWLQKLAHLNIRAISFPCLQISAQYVTNLDLGLTQQIQESDLLIVTSSNSIRCLPDDGLNALKRQSGKIISIGSGTSATLEQHNIRPYFTGSRGFDSERLLASDFLQSEIIRHKKIVILSGQGGRGVLEQQLKLRGAFVQKLEVYQRQCPDVSAKALLEKLQNQNAIFVITSQSALKNLLKIVPIEWHDWLKQQKFVVVSQRIKNFARQQKFSSVINTSSTSIEDIVNQFS